MWPDRIGTRISIILVTALVAEFIGSELVYRYSESNSARQEHVEQLADRLVVAERVLAALPPQGRAAAAQDFWRGSLDISWVGEGPSDVPRAADPDDVLRAALTGENAGLKGREVKLSVQNDELLVGALRMQDGSWILFRHTLEPLQPSRLFRHVGLTLIIVAAVAFVSLVLLRVLQRPLRETIKVIDGIDFGKPVSIETTGPRELQRVAHAINAMQERLLDLLNDRVHALAAVSHDLRTPIARLRLRAASIDDADLRAAIERDLAEMEAFMTTVLDYLRDDELEAPCLADIASIVQTIVDDARDLGGDAKYDGPSRMEVVVRPVKLGRVVTNLVQNALRHAGQARVSLVQSEHDVRIIVEDDGPGIPIDKLEEVFRPFHRLETSRNRRTGGAGLGLSIVKKSVERLGGGISIENRAEGGLRAHVTLPMQGDTAA